MSRNRLKPSEVALAKWDGHPVEEGLLVRVAFAARRAWRTRGPARIRGFRRIVLAGSLSLLTSCRSVPELPPVDLADPGWTVRQGQAVWRPGASGLELAGELIVATHPDGRGFVQFEKTPFPLVVAQTSGRTWQIRFVSQNRTRAGRGSPPAELLWLQLPTCLGGGSPTPPCVFTPGPSGRWRLENPRRDESLDGYLAPGS